MAGSAEVREWALAEGLGQQRGRLSSAVTAQWDAAHPDDPYVSAAPREGYLPGDMDDLFPDLPGGPAEPPDTGETRPRRDAPKGRPAARGTGLRGLFGGQKPAPRGKGRKPPRVSTESLLGSLWRGAAKLAAPLPPLHRTLRVQAPVAGLLLEDAVRETALDTVLQPLARMSQAGKVLSALVGPPLFVTAMSVHAAQRAAQDLPPNPVVMTMATEGLRSSLMTWLDVAGPKFEQAIAREQEFEAKYGADVDQFMAWLFSPPPASQDDLEAEEEMYRRASGMEPATM